MNGKDKPLSKQDNLLLDLAGDALADEMAGELTPFKTGSPVHRPELDKRLLELMAQEEAEAHARERRKRWRRSLQRAAVVLLFCVASLGTLFVTVEAFRIQVLNLLIREHDQYTDYRGSFTTEDIHRAGFRLFPDELPEGYALAGLEQRGTRSKATFTDPGGHTITFQQMEYGVDLGTDNEVDERQAVELGDGITGRLDTKDGTYTLNWQQQEYRLLLTGTDAITKDELLQMAASVKKIP